jgi:hypothetical protein
MWVADGDEKKAAADRGFAKQFADRLAAKYGQTDWAARAASLIYKVQQQIPIYGSDRE